MSKKTNMAAKRKPNSHDLRTMPRDPYFPEDKNSGYVQDWATEAARYLHDTRLQSVERTAAVIATYAQPILKLLEGLRKEHHVRCDYHDDGVCRCGASRQNDKIDKAIYGMRRRS